MTVTTTERNGDAVLLGRFLRDRRTKIDPASLGLDSARRRTPGLRREEVSQRAKISAAWYMNLEQGRGGSPSREVLSNIAEALLLTELEREHLFHLALGHAPSGRYRRICTIEPRLQRILDHQVPAPAFIKTATWDIVAWNRSARVLMPYVCTSPGAERNALRALFMYPLARRLYANWQGIAQAAVTRFRSDIVRAGAGDEVSSLVEELLHSSPEFHVMWQRNEISPPSHIPRELRHPILGELVFVASSFGVDGRNDLTMLVFLPATPEMAAKINEFCSAPPS